MGQISQFLRASNLGIAHYCPACRELHTFSCQQPDPLTGCKWVWDGNIIRPTLTPSINITWTHGNKLTRRCHYTLEAGILQFIEDCTHELKGIRMSLPALPTFLKDAMI